MEIPVDQTLAPSHSDYNQINCHGVLYTAGISIPAALFVVYLGFHLKKNIKKLSNRRSHVMIAYYLLLWFSAISNLVWCSLQVFFNNCLLFNIEVNLICKVY